MNKYEVKFYVGTNDAVESNLYLRCFYELMSHNIKVAWNYQSFREGNKIHVGFAAFGEVWIDYKERGKINNIYISTDNEEMYSLVSNNLKVAKELYKNGFVDYMVCLGIESDDEIIIKDQSYNNVSVHFDKESQENIISFGIKAFGDFDCKYVVTQKINYIKHLLCVYTNILFEIKSYKWIKGFYECCDEGMHIQDNDWVENSDLFVTYQELVLPSDFFVILGWVLNTEQYVRELRLVLNSAQQLYCANLMKRDVLRSGEYNIPGFVDLINTTLVSALEPLSNIGASKAETCSECGQLKYSIRKKVKDLCSKYLPEHLVKMIADELYSDRSAFLHEGNAKTNEFYCGRCMPLMDPVDGRSMMLPASFINFNMFDYVSYVIRKVVKHDVYSLNYGRT